jgi:hypothetical protein
MSGVCHVVGKSIPPIPNSTQAWIGIFGGEILNAKQKNKRHFDVFICAACFAERDGCLYSIGAPFLVVEESECG